MYLYTGTDENKLAHFQLFFVCVLLSSIMKGVRVHFSLYITFNRCVLYRVDTKTEPTNTRARAVDTKTETTITRAIALDTMIDLTVLALQLPTNEIYLY